MPERLRSPSGFAEGARDEQLGRSFLHWMTSGRQRALVESGGGGRPSMNEFLRFSARDQPGERLRRENPAHVSGCRLVLPREHEPAALVSRDEDNRFLGIAPASFPPCVGRARQCVKLQVLEAAEELLADRGRHGAPLVFLAPRRELTILVQRPDRERRQRAERHEEHEQEEGETAVRTPLAVDGFHGINPRDSTGAAISVVMKLSRDR